jgi:hypothetical protein
MLYEKRRYGFGPTFDEATAIRVYELLKAGNLVKNIALEVGLTEAQVGSLRSGGTRTYRYLFVKYEVFIRKIKMSRSEKPFGYVDDGFDLRNCNPALRNRADEKLLTDPWRVYKLSLESPNLMPMNPPPKKNGIYRAIMEDITANKHRGSPESVAAFKRIEGNIAKERARVLSVLVANPGGLIAQEIEDVLEISCCSVSARMAELKKSGLIARKLLRVAPDGKPEYLRRKTRSGATAGVYVVSGPDLDSKNSASLIATELGSRTIPFNRS